MRSKIGLNLIKSLVKKSLLVIPYNFIIKGAELSFAEDGLVQECSPSYSINGLIVLLKLVSVISVTS